MFINPAKTVITPEGYAKPVGAKILDPSKRIGEKPLPPPSKPSQMTPSVAVVDESAGDGNKVQGARKSEIEAVGQTERIKEKKRKRQLAASDSSETGSYKSNPKLPDKPPKKKPALSGADERQGGGLATITGSAVPPRPKTQPPLPKLPTRAPSPPPPPPVKRAPAAGEGLFIKKAKVSLEQY